MVQVIADQFLRAKMANFAETVEICDDQGRVLGYYAPVISQGRPMYEGVEIPFTEEEIKEFLQQDGGRPLADILADLEKRP